MITLDEVVALAEEVVSENPDVINPRAYDGIGSYSGMCLYNKDPNDPSDAAQRCLGGEMLMRLYVALPAEGMSIRYFSPFNTVFDTDAHRFLGRLQAHADSRYHDETDGTWKSSTWVKALAGTKNELNLT